MQSTLESELDPCLPIRRKALDLLARREHSRWELLTKLSRHFAEGCEPIEAVLDQLAEEGLQSDQRFTEAYVAMRKRRGFGPGRILMELKDRGIHRDLIAAELARSEHDWYALAAIEWRKKFSCRPAGNDEMSSARLDLRNKSRQVRFLQYRGFSTEHIQAVVSEP